jgi:hypothetical protein
MPEEPVSPTEPGHVIDACGAVMKIEHGSVPEVLYHLTASEGVAGILKARMLWASLAIVFRLNDRSDAPAAAKVIHPGEEFSPG